MVENLISSGIEDHTFGPMNLREHFPEEELTLGKNRFLEVASLVDWAEWNKIFIKLIWKQFVMIRVHEFAYWKAV